MKFSCTLILLIAFHPGAFSQSNIETDKTELKINITGNPPYPRLNQAYTVNIDLAEFKDSLYRSFTRQDPLEKTIPYFSGEHIPIFIIDSLSKGKHEIGPLNFTFKNLKFITNKLTFYVDDSLPLTNEGLWIRHMMTSDSTFCLIIEQRIPVIKAGNESEMEIILRNSEVCNGMLQFEPKPGDFDHIAYIESENGCSLSEPGYKSSKAIFLFVYEYELFYDEK